MTQYQLKKSYPSPRVLISDLFSERVVSHTFPLPTPSTHPQQKHNKIHRFHTYKALFLNSICHMSSWNLCFWGWENQTVKRNFVKLQLGIFILCPSKSNSNVMYTVVPKDNSVNWIIDVLVTKNCRLNRDTSLIVYSLPSLHPTLHYNKSNN